MVEKIISDDLRIYKYIGLDYIDSLLEKRLLYFRQIRLWPDMMELYLQKIVNRDLAERSYGSCWTTHRGVELVVSEAERETALIEIERNGLESMWKTYCPGGGIRIRSSLSKVRMAVQKYSEEHKALYQEGPVIYEYCQSPQKDRIDRLCFSKSPNFYTDDEYRFVIINGVGGVEGLNIVLDNMAHFIDEILVSPPVLNNSVQLGVSRGIYEKLFSINNEDFSRYEIGGGKPLARRKSVLYGRW